MFTVASLTIRTEDDGGGTGSAGLGGGRDGVAGWFPGRKGSGSRPLGPAMFVLLGAFLLSIAVPFLYFPKGLQLVGAIVLPLVVAAIGARVMM